MQCPSCRSGVLKPAHVEHGPACDTCDECAGELLDMAAYGDWLSSDEAASEQPPTPEEFEVADSKRALCCPQCQRIMVKFKVASDASHSIDFCLSCSLVWLDSGEWEYLKSKGLHTRIRSISTDSWQRKIREQIGARMRIENFKQSIGEEAFPVTEKFRLWLAEQPNRAEILRYLNVVE